MEDPNISPIEQQLLEEVRTLDTAANKLLARLADAEKAARDRERELQTVRRDLIELKEENQRLREMLQSWRQRLDTVLQQLRDID